MKLVNYRLKAQVLEVVENQLEDNNPKCTQKTLDRLMDLGYSVTESKEMIASILLTEMYDILKNQVEFNEKKYCKKLSKLPRILEDYENEEESTESNTVRNEQKISRNDPCHCGSGRKYKKCCGKG